MISPKKEYGMSGTCCPESAAEYQQCQHCTYHTPARQGPDPIRLLDLFHHSLDLQPRTRDLFLQRCAQCPRAVRTCFASTSALGACFDPLHRLFVLCQPGGHVLVYILEQLPQSFPEDQLV